MHSEEIVELKTQKNELVPISCLPAEIMATIFLFLKDSFKRSRDDRYGEARFNRSLKWVAVSHVCATWRSIALNTAELWAEPPIWNAPWAQEMIKRSKEMALTVEIVLSYTYSGNLTSPNVFSALNLVLRQAERIRCLTLHNIAKSAQGLVDALSLIRDFSCLERVHLSGKSLTLSAPWIVVPSSIFSAGSILREVSLAWCEIDWTHHLPSSVTTLKLDRITTPPPATFSNFIDVLRDLPSLEVLILNDALDLSHCRDYPSQTVKLSKLQKLFIRSTQVEEVASLFHSISFSPNISLSIYVNTLWQTSSQFLGYTKDMLVTIGKLYTTSTSDLIFRSLILGESLAKECSIAFSPFNNPDQNTIPQPNTPSLSLTFSLHPRVDCIILPDLITMIFKSGLPMDAIEVVSINNLPGFTLPVFLTTVGELSTVSHIRTMDPASKLVIHAIQHNPKGQSGKLCLEGLTTLEMQGVVFDPERTEPRRLTLGKLEHCFERRKECGAKITKLVLTECYCLNNYMVDMLRTMVPNVVWDGVQRDLR